MRACVGATMLAGAGWLASCSLFTSTTDLSGAGATDPTSDAAQMTDVLVSGVHAHWIALDVLELYWADDVSGGIYAAAKAGGAPRMIAEGQNHPWQLALDGNDVVWTNFGGGIAADGSAARAPKVGGPVTIIADALAQPWGIAVGTNQIFWTNSGDGTVMAAPR